MKGGSSNGDKKATLIRKPPQTRPADKPLTSITNKPGGHSQRG